MPIDPNTGMWSDEGSRFPEGTFGGALQIGNNQIAGQIAAENETKRELTNHLLDLQGQTETEQLNAMTEKRQWEEDAHAHQDIWEKWNADNPNASAQDRMKQALSLGIDKDAGMLMQMSYHDALLQNKEEAQKIDRADSARKEVKDLFAQGFAGADIADMLEQKYPPQSGVSPLYWQKIRALKISPMAQATITEKGALGSAATTKAAAAKEKADAGANDQSKKELDKLQKEKTQLLTIMQNASSVSESIADQAMKPDMVAAANQRIADAKTRIAQIEARIKELTPAATSDPSPHPSKTQTNTLQPGMSVGMAKPGEQEGMKYTLTDPGTKQSITVLIKNGLRIVQ